MSNPYLEMVQRFEGLLSDGLAYPLGGIPACAHPETTADTPRALFFAPHPDDECIMGGLLLRLLRESGMRVVNVAVTQGSNPDRQAARYEELQNACDYLGFDLVQTVENGLEKVNLKGREADPERWKQSVAVTADILREHQPRVIFFPHKTDWNSTHIGTHHLVTEALAQQDASFSCYTVETEFWGAMDDPNLMVQSSAGDVADLMAATSFHVKEVERNPYHLNQPSWMNDNVRRGAELVGGQGGDAPKMTFCTLFRLRRWANGSLEKFYEGGRILTCQDDPATLFND